jgi:type VI secretion system secreted protein Hcp
MSMRNHLLGKLSLAVAVAIPAHSVAAVDAFLKLDGIQGESTDAKHKNEIVVESWSLGVAPRVSATGQQTTARPCVSDIVITKHLDKSSPVLFMHAATGKHIPTGVIVVRKAGETPMEYLVVTMQDVVITSISSASGGGDSPQESLSLNFQTISISYTPQAADGAPLPPVQTASKGGC